MKNTARRLLSLMAGIMLLFTSALADGIGLNTGNLLPALPGTALPNEAITNSAYKSTFANNPISSEIFCADPTAVEYNGRLYVYGSSDHQQYLEKGPDQDNTYERIKSLTVFSTEDMVNWVYHGDINVGKIAPWIMNAWAPSIVSRVEADGLTHFYLYFSNNGTGVGVITATDPLGPWTDPLGRPFITYTMPELKDCPNPFDPGAVIDDKGDAYLAFGGGMASDGTDYMPGSARIVKLGEDMLSFASDFMPIPAPYFFEASELNYINGAYVYTHCSDWSDHAARWEYDCEPSTGCSMVYMTTKTPLDPDSWVMQGEYFKNPGLSGFDYSNNHTHLHKFKGQWYLLFHTMSLRSKMGIKGGYRSLCVEPIQVNEETAVIEKTGGSQKGVTQGLGLDPYQAHPGAEVNNTSCITLDVTDPRLPLAVSDQTGSWTSVRDVVFTEGMEAPAAQAEPILTAFDGVTYNLTVTQVDKETDVTMYTQTGAWAEHTGSIHVTGTGDYTLTVPTPGAENMVNLGYFRASGDAKVSMRLESIVLNGKYTIEVGTELTNTREWADGLKNIWSGLTEGDTVYAGENSELLFTENTIRLYVQEDAAAATSAPATEEPLAFLAKVKGTGRIEVRLDRRDGALLTSLDFDSPDAFVTVYNEDVAAVGGMHDLYFVYSAGNLVMQAWQFAPVSQLAKAPQIARVPGTMRDITTMELVRDMGVGINLGNTLESCGDWIAQWGDGSVRSYETAWGSPVVTQEMIQGYADAGFGVLRIPVGWSNLMGENYTISPAYMARVEEIVGWTLDAGMYAIINIHYDSGWVNTFPENKVECMKRFVRFWEQISENFRDHSDYLMFEAQNEEFGWSSMYNQWGGPSDKEGSFALVNELNQVFVDTVRASGGNNAKRHLLICGYNTDITHTCDPLYRLPDDPAGRFAVSVHYYTPAVFAILSEDADWGKARSTWGAASDLSELNLLMDKMKTTFIDKGVPVIIGEYGCASGNKEAEMVRLFLSSVCKAAYERQMCPILWDIPGGQYDRNTCQMTDPELLRLLMAIPE